MGRWSERWTEYEARCDIPEFEPGRIPRDVPRWTGREDIAGKRLLVWWEQGFGDTLQFARYAAVVRAIGAHVVMEVQEPLQNFLAANNVAEEVIANRGAAGRVDYHLPLMSFPVVLRHEAAEIPALDTPYRAQSAKIETWRERLG